MLIGFSEVTARHGWMEADKRCEDGKVDLFQAAERRCVEMESRVLWHCRLFSLQLLSIKKEMIESHVLYWLHSLCLYYKLNGMSATSRLSLRLEEEAERTRLSLSQCCCRGSSLTAGGRWCKGQQCEGKKTSEEEEVNPLWVHWSPRFLIKAQFVSWPRPNRWGTAAGNAFTLKGSLDFLSDSMLLNWFVFLNINWSK